MRMLVVVCIGISLVACSNSAPPPKHVHKRQPPAKTSSPLQTPVALKVDRGWEKVATFGTTTTVYMSPSGLADKYLIAQVLQTLRSSAPIQQVWFYDDLSKTPTGIPMTDSQMLHWRAKYNINRHIGYEEFAFIQVTNPKTSPPTLKEVKANIRPGYAE